MNQSGVRLAAGTPLVVTSHADARTILVSPAARVPGDVPPATDQDGPLAALVRRGIHLRSLWMWGCDSARREIRRKVAASAVGAAPISSLAPYLEMRAAALLDHGIAQGDVDLVGDFARPLIRDALMELFGVAPAQRETLDAQVAAMAGFIPGAQSDDTIRYFALSATARFLDDLWRRPLPDSAATSLVLRRAVEAGTLSLDEALAQATLLLFGNSYTTLDALTGLLARLAQEPSLWQSAKDGAVPVSALVEESLRLGPPSGLMLFREAADEIILPGGTIPAGTRIILPLDQLNRDPACYRRPEAFEPERAGSPHLAFGAGRHMCIGLHLARAVIRCAVEALLRRIPEWPGDIRVTRAPGVLGGATVTHMVAPAGTLRPC